MSAMCLTQSYFRSHFYFGGTDQKRRVHPFYLDGSLNVSGEDAGGRPGEERSAAASTPPQPRYPGEFAAFLSGDV